MLILEHCFGLNPRLRALFWLESTACLYKLSWLVWFRFYQRYQFGTIVEFSSHFKISFLIKGNKNSVIYVQISNCKIKNKKPNLLVNCCMQQKQMCEQWQNSAITFPQLFQFYCWLISDTTIKHKIPILKKWRMYDICYNQRPSDFYK